MLIIIGNRRDRVNLMGVSPYYFLFLMFGLVFGMPTGANIALANTMELNVLAHSNDWKKLLHYQNDESLIDYGTYFLSKTGKIDPLAELTTTLSTFRESPVRKLAFNQDARCLFPYRFKYLKTHFDDLIAPETCPELEAWLRERSADKTFLVFAAEYANNPASLMGHTFLRLQRPNQKIKQKHVSFLDPTFNFAARIPDDVGSLSYLLRGMTGGFEATFGDDTFENMIERYNNMESRDIWEYELNFNADQTHSLLLHIFELIKHAKWDYFFFDENCSFHILKAMEAVAPENELTKNLTTWVIPIDTIRSLDKAGLIKNWKYRPSVYTRTRLNYQALPQRSQKEFHAAINGGPTPGDQDTLDTLIEYLNYLKHSSEGQLATKEALILNNVLVSRAASGTKTSNLKISTPPSPQSSTGTMRWGTGFLATKGGSWLLGELRPAVHEYLSGTDPTSSAYQVVFLAPSFRYHLQKKRVDLQNLTLINTVNYRDSNPVGFSPVWRILVDIVSESDDIKDRCSYCKIGRVNPGMGIGGSFFERQLLIIGLATLHVEYGPDLERHHRFGPGAEIQTFVHLKGAKILLQGERWWDYRRSVFDTYSVHSTIKISNQAEIWLTGGQRNNERFVSLKYNVYQ